MEWSAHPRMVQDLEEGLAAANAAELVLAKAVALVPVKGAALVGMILGLAALTSWGLGRFRLLAAAFKPPAGLSPFSPQYNNLYAQYLVSSAHEVYTAIFLAAGILCLIAIIPSLFLEGRKQ